MVLFMVYYSHFQRHEAFKAIAAFITALKLQLSGLIGGMDGYTERSNMPEADENPQ